MEPLDFTPKLVAFDLDGTLTESKQNLDPEMGKLLGRLMEQMPIAVMSGAHFDQFQKQFLWGLPNTIPADRLYIFPTNAGQCYLWQDDAWQKQYDFPFTEEEKEEVIAALEKALAETGFGERPGQLWGEQIEDRKSQIAFSYWGQQAPLAVKRAWDPDEKKRQSIRKVLQPLLPEFTVEIGGSNTIDITHKGITKSFGLRKLSEITGIPIADMLYVGDALWEGGNDAVVKETGVRTLQVSGPGEAAQFIESLLS